MARNKNSGPGNISVVSYKSLTDMGQAIIQNQNDALAKITDAMAAQQGNKAGNTDNDQLDILRKTLEVQKELRKIAKSQQVSLNKAFEEQTKGMRGFKTVGDRFNSVKQGIIDALNPASIKKSILGSLNVFGLLNKQIAKVNFDERQKAYGVKGDFGQALKANREYAKSNEQLERLKRQAGLGPKASDRDIAALKGGQAALSARDAAKDKYLQFDPATMKAMQAQRGFKGFSNPNDVAGAGLTLVKPKKGDAGDTLKSLGLDKVLGGSKENQLESGRLLQQQTDLLQQIADNTAKLAGGGDNSTAGGAEDAGGGGLMSKFGKTMGGIAGALGGIGKGVGLGIGMAIGGIFTGIMSGIADGIKAFANVKVVAGVAVLGLLTGVVWGLSKALENFQSLDWSTLIKAGVALVGLIGAAALAGTFAPLMFTGALALAAIGGAVYVIGEAMSAMGDGLQSFVDGMERLANLDGDKISGLADAITSMGAALAVFGAGEAFAGLMTLVTNLLTIGQDSPVEQLAKIASYGDGILKAAQGFDSLGRSMKSFKDVKPDDMKAINEFPWKEATKFVAAGGAMTVKGVTVYNASQMNADQKADLMTPKDSKSANVNTNVQTNNNTTTIVKPNIRNQESSQSSYIGQRYKTSPV